MDGAIVQAVMSIVGELMASGQRAEAEAMLNRLRNEFRDIPLPDLEEIEAIQLGPSAMEGITTDPALEGAQYDALGQVSEVADKGLSDVDKALLSNIANRVNRQQRAGMAGIEADMAGRGLAGSGMDYALRMENAQQANQRLGQAGLDIGADSLERRLKAAFGMGDMAGKMRGQSWDEKSAKARATDEVNRQNAAARTQAQYYNARLPQQRFQNQMQKTGAIANPTNALAGFKVDSANDTRNAFAGYGAAAREGINAGKTSTYGSGYSGYVHSEPYQDALDDEEDGGYVRRKKLNYGEDR